MWCGRSLLRMLVVAVSLFGATTLYADGGIDGAWEMIGYDGTTAAVGPAEGLLVVADGRFSLVYTMSDTNRPRSGRAHAGDVHVGG